MNYFTFREYTKYSFYHGRYHMFYGYQITGYDDWYALHLISTTRNKRYLRIDEHSTPN